MSDKVYIPEWQPIETAPIKPFDPEKWYMPHSPSLLVWNGNHCVIARYSYTRGGKGRWQDHHGNITPAHWMPLPSPPEQSS